MRKNRYAMRSIIVMLIAALMLSMMPMTVSAASKNPGRAKITSMKAGKVSKKTNQTTVTVKWNKVKGATGYVVYEKHAADNKWRKVKTLGRFYKGIKIKKVPAGRYYVRVRAVKKVKGKKYYGKYSKARSVYIKSKWNVKKSIYAGNGKAEIKKLNAEISEDGASVKFSGNKMIISFSLEKLAGGPLSDEQLQDEMVRTNIQEIKAGLKNNKEFKKMAKWLRNATGVKAAKLVIELKNGGKNLFTIYY